MKKIGDIFFYVTIIVFTSAMTFLILDWIAWGDRTYNIFVKKNNISTDLYLDAGVHEEANAILDQVELHGASVDYVSQLDKLCKSDHDICAIITIIDKAKKLTERKVYDYHVLVAYVLQKVGSYWYEDILNYISQINIDSKTDKTRWYATSNGINLNLWLIWSYMEFYQVFTHEFGHLLDLGYINGNSKSLDTNFTEFGRKTFAIDDPSIDFYKISWDDEFTRSKNVGYKDFVSGYGMSDTFEDFSETLNFYLNHHDVFLAISNQSTRLQAKYNYMNNLFKGSYIRADKIKLKSFDKDIRPYDTTRF